MVRRPVLPWRVLESRVTFRDRWLTLRSDRCLNADGVTIDPFHVIERSDWINVVALTRDARLVLAREYRHGVGRVVDGLPSGTMDADEKDPLAAMRRELREETGYGGGDFSLLLAAYPNPANHTNTVHSFLARDVEPVGAQQLDRTETIEVVLADLAELLGGIRRGAVLLEAAHIAALWSAVPHILAGSDAATADLRRRLAALIGQGA